MALRFVRNFWDSVTGSIRPLGSDFDGLSPKLSGFAAATDHDGLTTKAQVEEMIDDASGIGVGITRFVLSNEAEKSTHKDGDNIAATFTAAQADESQYELIVEGVFPYSDRASVYSVRIVEDTETPADIFTRQPSGTLGYGNWKLYCSFSVKAGQDGDPDPFSGEYPILIQVVKDLGGDDEEVVSEISAAVNYEEPV